MTSRSGSSVDSQITYSESTADSSYQTNDTMSSDSSGEKEEEEEEIYPPRGVYIDMQPPRPKDPRMKAKYNIISRLLFFWLDPLFFLGLKRELQQEDLYAHPQEADSSSLLARFNWYWKRELKRSRSGLPARLWLALVRCIQWRLVLQGLLILLEAGILLFQSVVLGFLTEFFNIEDPTQTEKRNAYLYALGLVMLSFLVVLMHSHSFLMGQKMSMMLRIISTAAIYQKVLSLSQATVGQLSVGHIVNLASNDVQRFDPVFPHFPYLWVSPIHLTVFTYLAYREVGWTGFLATGFIILQVPLQIVLARFFVYLRFKSASLTDKRIHVMNEVITGVRVIKMYAWEHAFKKLVEALRKQESGIIFKGSVIRACNLAYMIVSTSMIMWLVLTVRVSTGGELSTRQVFTLLSLLTSLRLSSYFFVLALLGFSEGRVAVHRIQEFLLHEDVVLSQSGLDYTDSPAARRNSSIQSTSALLPLSNHQPRSTDKVQLSSTYFADSTFIKVGGMSASWSYNEEKLVLEDIHFEVNEHIPLLAVLGPVGAGKSSLLLCLLGELQALQGTVEVRGTISYVSQEPWMFTGTLRENILFGEKFDQAWYDRVLDACSLDEDIKHLPQGDSTMVGERGVALSGGQKARVNLARAVYHDSDIFLLDDPLSALDVNVALHIYNNCIRGLLEDRLVVLVTHQTQFALSADRILLIKNGQQQLYSNYQELMVQGVDPSHLIGLVQDEEEDEEEEVDEGDMFDYKKCDPPSPTTISLLSTTFGDEDGHITPFSFVGENDNLESETQTMTPLALFSKSVKGLHPGNTSLHSGTTGLHPRNAEMDFMNIVSPIRESSETSSISSDDNSSNQNPVTVNSVEDSSPIKLQSNGMIGHREDNAQSAQQLSSEWPFAKSSPCVQQSLSQENCDGDIIIETDVDSSWPFANQPPTSPVPSAWPFAKKPPAGDKSSKVMPPTYRAKRFVSTLLRLPSASEAWPLASHNANSLSKKNPQSPLVNTNVMKTSPSHTAKVSPAHVSSNQIQAPLSVPPISPPPPAPWFKPTITLLPPTPSPPPNMQEERLTRKPSSLLLNMSSEPPVQPSAHQKPNSLLLNSSKSTEHKLPTLQEPTSADSGVKSARSSEPPVTASSHASTTTNPSSVNSPMHLVPVAPQTGQMPSNSTSETPKHNRSHFTFPSPLHYRRSPLVSPAHRRRFSINSSLPRRYSVSHIAMRKSPSHHHRKSPHLTPVRYRRGESPLVSPDHRRKSVQISPRHVHHKKPPRTSQSHCSSPKSFAVHSGSMFGFPSPVQYRKYPSTSQSHKRRFSVSSTFPMYPRRYSVSAHVSHRRSPHVSPVHLRKSPHISPVHLRKSPHISPVHLRKSPHINPVHLRKSPRISPVHFRHRSPHASPMHNRRSPHISPSHLMMNGHLHGKSSFTFPSPVRPLTSNPSHRAYGRRYSGSGLNPLTSPMHHRRHLHTSPLYNITYTTAPTVAPEPVLNSSQDSSVDSSVTSSPMHGTSHFASPAHGGDPFTGSLLAERPLTDRPRRKFDSSPFASPMHRGHPPMFNKGATYLSPMHSRPPLGSQQVKRISSMRNVRSPHHSSATVRRIRSMHAKRSQIISPMHGRRSQLTSPLHSRLGSPAHNCRTPMPDEGLVLNLEPGRFDAASIYTTRSIGSRMGNRINLISQPDDEDGSEENGSSSDLGKESRSQGTISLRTYLKFFKAGGGALLLAVTLTLLVLGEAGIVVSDWWLSDWANCFSITKSAGNNVTGTCSLGNNERIGVYTTTTLIATIFSFSRAILFCFVCINASKILHNRMFKAVLHARVLFFDLNPVGRVLNRFSKDIGFLDDLLPYTFCEFLLLFLRCLAVIITAIASNVWLTFPAIAIIIIFILLRSYYLRSARDVKRLEAIARSPVYAHLSTTIQGLSTIRSYQREEVALRQLHMFQNEHSQGWYLYLVMVRWFGLRIDTLSVAFLAAVAFISIPLASELDAGLVGLSLTYTISLADMLQYTIRLSADVENTMISAERVMEYGGLESESSHNIMFYQQPPDNWPSEGEIKMNEVMFQYAPDYPMVLKGLSFTVKKSEKVGIVGRTGAGKSSLISVLYRLAEPYGQITIDGVDTKTIGLHDLRKKMSIIPQDPVLFSGTMRYNLDPFDEYSDAELWGVLEQVQLKTAVEELEGQLSGEVSEGGSNFSVGQRQLVCLARALLRKNKILILDEATANVDPRTDGIIQKAIHEKFSACTTLVIAHRLDTIMDADKIMVLKNGRIKEFDSPYKLLQDPNSRFYMMVEKTGLTASGRLHQMALESHLRRMFKKNGRITPAQAKGSVKKMSALFAQSLLQRSTGSGPFGLSKLQERRASILSSNSFPRALNEMGVGGPGVISANDPNLQNLRLPSDPNVAPSPGYDSSSTCTYNS